MFPNSSQKKLREPRENICHIECSNEAVQLIDLSAMFNNINVYIRMNHECDETFNFNTSVLNIHVNETLEPKKLTMQLERITI